MTPQPKALHIQKTAQTAIAATLQATPLRYRALKTRLATLDSPLFFLDFSLVDDAKIQSVNRQFRGLDKPTDVLSFSQFEDQNEEFSVDFPTDGQEIALGDLMISIQTAARQANELDHSLEREIAFLCIHGTLHLLGYDHLSGSDRRAMWKWQDAVFAVWEEGSGEENQNSLLPGPSH